MSLSNNIARMLVYVGVPSAVGGLEGAVGGALISAVGSSGYRIKDE